MRFTFKWVLVWLVLSAAVKAQDFDAGLEAARAGDYATALAEWRPLAEQGNANAQHNLGVMYDFGRGVPQDVAEAARWYRAAADQGNVQAQFNLGMMYDFGDGVSEDDAEAVRWYRLAAEQGMAQAQINLGLMYGSAWLVTRDYVAAHMWLNLAVANGQYQAVDVRDEVAEQMTPEQIAEAQRRARVCLESNYVDCD